MSYDPSFVREVREPARGTRDGARASKPSARSMLIVLSTIALTACTSAASPEPSIVEDPPMNTGDGEPPPADTLDVDQSAVLGGSNVPAPPAPEISAAAILAKLAACTKVSQAPYAKDARGAATIDVCQLGNAVYWTADLDVDCDGRRSAVCNEETDPSYQSQTATTDSKGKYLDAATLPFVVVPGVSSRWDYKEAGVAMGSIAIVIYKGKLAYGIVGDIGPTGIIGEASYAMAKQLGINPDPSIGGTSSDVTYVVFTGTSALVSKKEDNAEAILKGMALATALLTQ